MGVQNLRSHIRNRSMVEVWWLVWPMIIFRFLSDFFCFKTHLFHMFEEDRQHPSVHDDLQRAEMPRLHVEQDFVGVDREEDDVSDLRKRSKFPFALPQ